MAIRVYLAIGSDVIREGIKSILNRNNVFNICGESINNNTDIIYQIEKLRPTLLFFDAKSSDNIILKNIKKIKTVCPKLFIFLIIYSCDFEFYKEVISVEEINGFLDIEFKVEDLLKGISIVLTNKKYVHDLIKKHIDNDEVEQKDDKYKINLITKRELDVLIQVSYGMFNKEIATNLNISERTVKNHLSSIFKKLEVSDRTQAAVFAIKNGIVNL